MKLVAIVLGLLLAAGTAWAQDPAAAQFDFANGLFQRGFHKEAAKEYRAYVEQYPKAEQAPTALYRLGEAEYASKNYGEALKALDRFLETGRTGDLDARAKLRKGELLYRLKRTDEAVAILAPLTGEGLPGEVRAPAFYYLGKVNHEAGKPAEAQAALHELVEKFPDSPLAPYARFQLAYVLLALNDAENAAIEFSNVAGSDADPALKMESRFRAAEAYDTLKWYDAALKAYQQLRTEFPDSEYAKKAAYGFTWALYHAGKFGEAAQAAEEYVKQDPDSDRVPGMKYLQANCLQQQQQYEPAVALYREIVQKYPNTEFAQRAQYKAPWALYLGGKILDAKAEATRFLETNKDPAMGADAVFLLASIAYAEKDYAAACEHFANVAENYKDSEFAAESLFKAGECQSRLGRVPEAAQTFEQFAARYPDNPLAAQAVLRAADAQFLASSFEGAIEKYKKALEAKPDAATEQDVLYRLALAYNNVQNYEASANTFRALIDKYPENPHVAEAHLRIGDFLLRDGKDPVKAMASYEAAQKAAPEGELAGRALKGVALARYDSKDYDGAAEMFLRVIREYPDVSLGEKTFTWLGQRLFDQSKWEESATVFQALLKHAPDYPDVDAVELKIAQSRESAGQADEAIKLYKPLAESSNDRAVATEAKFHLARLYETKKETDAAVKLYEELAAANAGDVAAQAQFHLGEIDEAKGDCASAATRFMRVAILFVHEQLTPESLWRAGQCFEKVGSAEEARKAYQEVVTDYPQSEQTAKAKDRLAKLGA